MNTFEQEVWAALKALNSRPDFFSWRIFDTHTYWNSAAYVPKQPGDFFAVCGGRAPLVELKSAKTEPSFISDNIHDHQMKSMIDFMAAGGRSLFLLCRRKHPKHIKCYAITPQDFVDIRISTGRKSVRWDDIEQVAQSVPRIKGGWDFGVLFPDVTYQL